MSKLQRWGAWALLIACAPLLGFVVLFAGVAMLFGKNSDWSWWNRDTCHSAGKDGRPR